MAVSLTDLNAYVGRGESAEDVVTASAIAKLAATLGVDNPAPRAGDAIPPGWHAPFFGAVYGPSDMRADGQQAGGGIVPAVPLPRRRLLGDAVEFHRPLVVGDAVTRLTEVADIAVDESGGDAVVHLVLRQSISGPRGLAVVEERRFFYLAADGAVPPEAADTPPAAPAWQRVVEPDPVLLFRISALRFNSHRIHYDRDYATGVEGCPGLVVPGVLIALQLLEICRAGLPDRPVARFAFRAARPVYDTGPYTLCGSPEEDGASARLWVTDGGDAPAVTATARFAG